MDAGNLLDRFLFFSCGRSLLNRKNISLDVSDLWSCGTGRTRFFIDAPSSYLAAGADIPHLHFRSGICHRLAFAHLYRCLPMGLQRSAHFHSWTDPPGLYALMDVDGFHSGNCLRYHTRHANRIACCRSAGCTACTAKTKQKITNAKSNFPPRKNRAFLFRNALFL